MYFVLELARGGDLFTVQSAQPNYMLALTLTLTLTPSPSPSPNPNPNQLTAPRLAKTTELKPSGDTCTSQA